ncbi:hypothetical protein AT6N2_C0077 [Agrobacterium tumefaciens]|nr:hypothetical protein AT6N2_C0077 [Agrobacterium tumefaciens]
MPPGQNPFCISMSSSAFMMASRFFKGCQAGFGGSSHFRPVVQRTLNARWLAMSQSCRICSKFPAKSEFT